MRTFNHAVLGVALATTLLAALPEAQAMPVAPVVATSAQGDAGIQEARLVCGPFRCFRRFGYRPFGFHRHFGFRHHRRW